MQVTSPSDIRIKGTSATYVIMSSPLSWDPGLVTFHSWQANKNLTINATNTSNSTGQYVIWAFGSNGTNYTITFGTGFNAQGVVNTGTSGNCRVEFFNNSGTWVELNRTYQLPIINTSVDSVTALQITKADGTTVLANFDTTNARVGLGGNVAPGYPLDVTGDINTSTDLKIGGTSYKDVTASLTNKTITDSTNNVMASSLKSATTTVDVSAATAPSSGKVLTATDSTHATWQTPTGVFTTQTDVTSSRAVNTVYQNTTGKPMYVSVTSSVGSGGATVGMTFYSDASNPPTTALSVVTYANSTGVAWTPIFVSAIVLPSNYYKLSTGNTTTLQQWIETY